MPEPPFSNQTQLIWRIDRHRRRGDDIVFVVGSGLVLPGPDHKGVPGAEDIIGAIRAVAMEDPAQLKDFDKKLVKVTVPGGRYQEAFQWICNVDGGPRADEIVRDAVACALKNPDRIGRFKEHAAKIRQNWGNLIESSIDDWVLNPGVVALGEILAASIPGINRVLTTNFDPLIEVAVRVANGRPFGVLVNPDGSFNGFTENGIKIVHLNGHWCIANTLHTRIQLSDRPNLAFSMEEFVNDDIPSLPSGRRLVVVVGYGGWPDDVVTKALCRGLGRNTDIAWTFFADGVSEYRRNPDLFVLLAPQMARNAVIFYERIDANLFFPALRDQLRVKAKTATKRLRTAAKTSAKQRR